jgi:hypothetical protein
VPHGCEVVFCKECAEEVRRELFNAYLAVILAVILRGVPYGWVFARVTFTLRSDGSEITPDRVQTMFDAAHRVLIRSVGRRNGYGALMVAEVGFEKRGHLPDAQRVAHGLNLHAHGLYFGPRLDWERTRDLWMGETRKKFGVESLGFWIGAVFSVDLNGKAWVHRDVRRYVSKNFPGVAPEAFALFALERAVRWALNHMFKYVSSVGVLQTSASCHLRMPARQRRS